MNNRENKAIAFLIALSDVYKDVDDRELDCISPLTIPRKRRYVGGHFLYVESDAPHDREDHGR